MINKEKILLIDFSQVVSPIGISRYLSERFSKFLKISKEEIWGMYKKHVSSLVKGEYSICVFIEEVVPYLKSGYSKNDLFEASKEVPPLDMDFLRGLQKLKKSYYVYLTSDIHEVLGEVVKKELKDYFDGFILSYEEKARKCEDIFWENLQKKIDFSKVELFVDDKEKNINVAEKYGIKGLVYDMSLGVESVISIVSG